jgi:hypothetical protein
MMCSIYLNRTFGWTNSRTQHEVYFEYDDVSGEKLITFDGKDVYNKTNADKGLSYSWETRKGHLFQIEFLDNVVFSIDDIPFEEFMFPRPVRSPSEEMDLDASDDEEGYDDDDDEEDSVLSRYTAHHNHSSLGGEECLEFQYTFDIEVINPTVQKGENYVTYTVLEHETLHCCWSVTYMYM